MGCARLTADGVAVDGSIAPTEHGQALLLRNALEDALALQSAVFFHRQKAHGHAIGAEFRQADSQFAALTHKKGVGNLNQDSGPVAGFRIATRCASVRKVDQDLKALADNLVGLFAANAGDQSHTAGIMLIPWMIETLRLRSAERIIRCIHGNLFNESFQCRMNCLAGKTQTQRDSCRGNSPDPSSKGLPEQTRPLLGLS